MATKEQRALAQACIRAAKKVHRQDDFSCNVLNFEVAIGHCEQYSNLFSPDDTWESAWLHQAVHQHQILQEECHEWRVTALCFAAAMAETGDL